MATAVHNADNLSLFRWQGRAEIRRVLPTVDELLDTCHFAGVGTDENEYWLCCGSAAEQLDEGGCSWHEYSEDLSSFYGQPVYVCMRKRVDAN